MADIDKARQFFPEWAAKNESLIAATPFMVDMMAAFAATYAAHVTAEKDKEIERLRTHQTELVRRLDELREENAGLKKTMKEAAFLLKSVMRRGLL